MKSFAYLLAAIFILQSCYTSDQQENTEEWSMTSFVKVDTVNPVLLPSDEPTFECPIREEVVNWEAKDVFNPTVVVREDKLYMIYRAEDTVGKYAGTSRLGLAVSDDGFHFKKMPQPIFYPDNDAMKTYEWEGGVEDPRLVENENGRYFMTYTAYDGKTARLLIASSDDLLTWEKHGLVLGEGKYRDHWSKSGAIISKLEGNKMVAQKINGKYWMYFGDTDIFAATSDDLITWIPVEDENGDLVKIFGPRKGKFDSQLVEPGPPPIIREEGIVFIYNSRNLPEIGDTTLPEGTYAAGQVLIHPDNPLEVIDRTEDYFFKPDKDYEITGQVNNVCFLEGLTYFKGKWFLYYGTADSKIAVAVMEE